MKDLTQLTRFEDCLSFLYLEKGHIEQHQRSIAYVTEKEGGGWQPRRSVSSGVEFTWGAGLRDPHLRRHLPKDR